MKKDTTTYKNQFKKDNYDSILIATPKGIKEIWKEEAKQRKMSLSQFIQTAVNLYIKNCPAEEMPSITNKIEQKENEQ